MLPTSQRRALGWLLLAASLIPLGDMAIVFSYGGSAGAAYGIHFTTAAVVAMTGYLTLRAQPVSQPRRAAGRRRTAG
jgi:hypothetical protein